MLLNVVISIEIKCLPVLLGRRVGFKAMEELSLSKDDIESRVAMVKDCSFHACVIKTIFFFNYAFCHCILLNNCLHGKEG